MPRQHEIPGLVLRTIPE